MLRFLTAGESHGPAEVAILEGMPAGLSLEPGDIQKDLDKRRSGMGRGGRGKIETDHVEILSGVRKGLTLGSPIALVVKNIDFTNWQEVMSLGVKPIHPWGDIASHLRIITNPRPGHADLAGVLKYGFSDMRNVIERASARETVMRVATGAVCKKLLKEFAVEIASHTIQIGNIFLSKRPQTKKYTFEDILKVYEKDPEIRCVDSQTSLMMKQAVLKAIKEKYTLGGVIEIIASNVPVGLGSYVHYDRKLDGQIAQMMMSIPSVKAVEIGEGITNASKSGSKVHDEINYIQGNYRHQTNRAGGIEGGVTNGENIVCRIFLKPISTLGNPLKTVDTKTKKPTLALIERSDICVVPRAGVIAEAGLAYVLAKEFLNKFGSDSMPDIKQSFEGYKRRISTM